VDQAPAWLRPPSQTPPRKDASTLRPRPAVLPLPVLILLCINLYARRVTPYLRLSSGPSDASLRAASPLGRRGMGETRKGRTVALRAASFSTCISVHFSEDALS
jgi:hypothetical protein